MKMSGAKPTATLICRLALRIKNELNNAFQECGVSVTSEHWSILKCLWQQEGISQSEIAEKVNKDKASITRILDIMQKNELIERHDDELDRRSYRIFLTKKGKSLESTLRPLAQATNRQLTQNLDEYELQELHRLLLKMAGEDK